VTQLTHRCVNNNTRHVQLLLLLLFVSLGYQVLTVLMTHRIISTDDVCIMYFTDSVILIFLKRVLLCNHPYCVNYVYNIYRTDDLLTPDCVLVIFVSTTFLSSSK